MDKIRPEPFLTDHRRHDKLEFLNETRFLLGSRSKDRNLLNSTDLNGERE